MSIALSVTVRPSRHLLVLMSLICLLCLLAAGLVYSADPAHYPFALRLSLAITCVVLSVSAFFRFLSQRKTWSIDISGNGKIQLREHATTGLPHLAQQNPATRVQLLASSTLWPGCLLLRFSDDNQSTTSLVVMQDSLCAEGFKALAVACHWIAEHNGPEQ